MQTGPAEFSGLSARPRRTFVRRGQFLRIRRLHWTRRIRIFPRRKTVRQLRTPGGYSADCHPPQTNPADLADLPDSGVAANLGGPAGLLRIRIITCDSGAVQTGPAEFSGLSARTPPNFCPLRTIPADPQAPLDPTDKDLSAAADSPAESDSCGLRQAIRRTFNKFG